MGADFSVRYRKSNLHHTHCHSERSARGAKPRAEGEETAPPRLEDNEAADISKGGKNEFLGLLKHHLRGDFLCSYGGTFPFAGSA